MKLNVTWIACCLLFASITCYTQDLSQSVKGKIIDATTGVPVPNASVVVSQGDKNYSASTGENGQYNVELPVGRYKITVTITGYEAQTQELLVISGRQAVLNFSINQKVQMLKEVEVSASTTEDNVPGVRSLTIEKTLRFPANFFDPVRVATAYPGVVATNDQNNSIIVRGNSPTGLLWRLNGLDIVNPNHLANAGTLSDKPAANGGGVNILSAQMLDRTNFYMGAFPTRYGNALAGIIDMKLREGNKSKREYTAQASLIGMDLAAEGPIGKKQNTSFLANYRYSTVGLLSKMGVNFGDESINFQDFSFNLDKDLAKGGKLSLFGMYGYSINKFKHKEQKDWKEDKDQFDIDYSSSTLATGFNYSANAFRKTKVFLGLAYSSSSQERTQSSQFVNSQFFGVAQDRLNVDKSIVSFSARLEGLVGQNSRWEAGILTNAQNDVAKEQFQLGGAAEILGPQNFKAQGLLVQPFIDWSTALSSKLTVTAGLHYLYYTFNNTSQIGPRLQLTYAPTTSSAFDLSYNLASQIQQASVYWANKNADLTKSHRFDATYRKQFESSLTLRTGIFYQKLYDVPLGAPSTSTILSVLNAVDYTLDVLNIKGGEGENYGVDATVEKQFFNNHFFMVGGSYYESKFTAANGKVYDTRFNGKYTFTSVYGKEWTKPSRNRTIGLSTRLLYLGGLRVTPINAEASIATGVTQYDMNNPYSEKLNDYFRLDLRLNFRKNKARYTRTFAIDIQNLTSQQNEAYRYYDGVQKKIVTKYQLGIIPILVYRIDF